jgi:sulfotransferase
MSSPVIFFNSSMPRSCSTLIQNIMGQNPLIHVTPTDGVLELLYSARSQYSSSPEFKAQDSELMLRGWRNFCNAGLHGFYSAVTEKPYVVSKSRGWGLHWSFLNNFLPYKPKVICMVRDIKEIVASLEKIHRKIEESGTDHLINHAELRNTTTAKRVDYFLGSQPLGLALERVNEVFLFGWAEHFLFIRAEELCKDPQSQIDRVYDYLELEKFSHDFENVEQITQEDDGIYGLTPDLHTVKKQVRPLEKSARQVLGKNICDWIDNNPAFEVYNKNLGYF